MSTGFNAQCLPGAFDVATATFTEKEILLPQSLGGQLPGIMRVEIELDDTWVTLDDKYFKWHLSITSESSIKQSDGHSVICSDVYFCKFEAGAGLAQNFTHLVRTKDLPAPVITTMQKLYLGVLQNTGSTINVKFRVWFVPRSAPGLVQRQNLVNQNQF